MTHLGNDVSKQITHESGVRLRKSLHHKLAVFDGKRSGGMSGVDGAMKRHFNGSLPLGDGGVPSRVSIEGLDCIVQVGVLVCGVVETMHNVVDSVGDWKGTGAADEGGGHEGAEETLDSNHLGCCCRPGVLFGKRRMQLA